MGHHTTADKRMRCTPRVVSNIAFTPAHCKQNGTKGKKYETR